jgi:hypothetical protein
MYRRLPIVGERLSEAGSLHLKNRDVMMRHLVGENLSNPDFDSLRQVMALLEPVKHYKRGGQQVWANQLIPLVGLADAIPPESAAARDFSGRVFGVLFDGPGFDADKLAALKDEMAAWSSSSSKVVAVIAPVFPAVREAIAPSQALIAACAVGQEAAASLSKGVPLADGRLAADLAVLDNAAAPNESATELPVLKPIRLMVAAAARQASRAGSAPGAWHDLVVATAHPAAAESD